MAMEKFKTAESNADGARTLEMEYDFGGNVDEACEKFGDDVVFGMFVKNAKIALQSRIRDWMKAAKTDEEIIQLANTEWVPGVRQPRVSANKTESLIKAFGKMSAEDKAKILAALGAPAQA